MKERLVAMSKKQREWQVLLGLVDYYIKTGKPVGSNTLKDEGFETLSAATIRNYFAHLEDQGFLQQQHASGGRLPTDAALKVYAAHIAEQLRPHKTMPVGALPKLKDIANSHSISAFLQCAADTFSNLTGCAVFLSAPRFDQDFVIALKLMNIDRYRCLCVIITEFGSLQTEILPTPYRLSSFALKRLENYCHAKLHGTAPPPLPSKEVDLAENFYNELMVRYLIHYANFSQEQIYTTGLARLLSNPEFQDAKLLANSMALFENQQGLCRLIQECCQGQQLRVWIGDDLAPFGCCDARCAVLAIPYFLHRQPVGTLGLLGPPRLPYHEHMLALRHYAEAIGEGLTHTLYKHKITYRQPRPQTLYLEPRVQKLLAAIPQPLLEDQSEHTLVSGKKVLTPEKIAHGRRQHHAR